MEVLVVDGVGVGKEEEMVQDLFDCIYSRLMRVRACCD